jgi:hypothetical protein
MGERMELKPHAKSTLEGSRATASAPDMEDAEQGEEAPRGVEIDPHALG